MNEEKRKRKLIKDLMKQCEEAEKEKKLIEGLKEESIKRLKEQLGFPDLRNGIERAIERLKEK